MRQPCGQQGGNNFRQELSGLSKTKAHSWFLHGVAVAQGLIFAIKWSQHQGYLAAAAEERALAILTRLGFPMPKEFVREFCVMARSKLLKLLSEDKKLTDTRNLNFAFLERIGAAFRKKVILESF